ncbi:hypothetical protein V6N13_016167 [Hibiscus sabdariffa]
MPVQMLRQAGGGHIQKVFAFGTLQRLLVAFLVCECWGRADDTMLPYGYILRVGLGPRGPISHVALESEDGWLSASKPCYREGLRGPDTARDGTFEIRPWIKGLGLADLFGKRPFQVPHGVPIGFRRLWP